MSGSGSNLQSIIDNTNSGYIDAGVAVVISNVADAYGLERARLHDIPAKVVDFLSFPTREDYDSHIVGILNSHEVDLVILAGYMKVVTKVFIDAFRNRIINIHPALLPSFPGLHVQQKAIDNGAKFSGCTVHFVDEGVDTGPIIAQAVVPVLDDDTHDTLAARILIQEHKIFPMAVRLYAQGRLKIQGRRVVITPPVSVADEVLINPPLNT